MNKKTEQTMSKQLIFKEKYIHKLKDDVSSGNSLEFYKDKNFIFDDSQLLVLPNVHSINIIDKLDENDDFNSAIIIYEALKLEPIQASDERLWVYLAHVDLYSYMIKRWPGVYNGVAPNPKKYILDHWFLSSTSQNNLLRHAISGLWWAVHLSVDKSSDDDKYALTKILFRQLDFATRTLGTYMLGRHKEAVVGILEFIQENDDLFKDKFQDKTRFITEHLNYVGGVKPIAYFDRDFFKIELQKIKDQIAAI